jgi:hypothetical protein
MQESAMQFEDIFSFRSLFQAHKVCRKERKLNDEVVRYEIDLSNRLIALEDELLSGNYKIKGYQRFTITSKSKHRVVQSLFYKDKIVQYVLCVNFLRPAFEKVLLPSNCACRLGMGIDYAIRYLHKILTRNNNDTYFLKCDIRHFFANVEHEIVYDALQNFNFGQRETNLIKYIVNRYNSGTPGIGLPLGQRISLFIASIMLHSLDVFVTDTVGDNYVRFMDDFIIVCKNENQAKDLLDKIMRFLKELKLELNEKTRIIPVKIGCEFLGFNHKKNNDGVEWPLTNKAKVKMRKKMRKYAWQYKKKLVSKKYVQSRYWSYYTHVKNSPAALTYFKNILQGIYDCEKVFTMPNL